MLLFLICWFDVVVACKPAKNTALLLVRYDVLSATCSAALLLFSAERSLLSAAFVERYSFVVSIYISGYDIIIENRDSYMTILRDRR